MVAVTEHDRKFHDGTNQKTLLKNLDDTTSRSWGENQKLSSQASLYAVALVLFVNYPKAVGLMDSPAGHHTGMRNLHSNLPPRGQRRANILDVLEALALTRNWIQCCLPPNIKNL